MNFTRWSACLEDFYKMSIRSTPFHPPNLSIQHKFVRLTQILGFHTSFSSTRQFDTNPSFLHKSTDGFVWNWEISRQSSCRSGLSQKSSFGLDVTRAPLKTGRDCWLFKKESAAFFKLKLRHCVRPTQSPNQIINNCSKL